MRFLCSSLVLAIALHGAPCQAAGESRIIASGASGVVLSSDGKEIIFTLAGRLWQVSSRGGRAERVVPGEDWQSRPALSSDGQFLAYRLDRATASEVAVLNRDTGEVMTAWPPDQRETDTYPQWLSAIPDSTTDGFAFATIAFTRYWMAALRSVRPLLRVVA